MSKLNRVDCYKPENALYGYQYRCPGCGETHTLPVGMGNGEGYARWQFDGNMDKPTFYPSVLARGNKIEKDADGDWTGHWLRDANGKTIPYTCHSFVKEGKIQFLGDCTHELAGATVDMVEWTNKKGFK